MDVVFYCVTNEMTGVTDPAYAVSSILSEFSMPASHLLAQLLSD